MESDRTDPPLTAADLDEIDAKLKPCTDPPFEVIGTRVSCGISRRGREIVVRADEHDIDDLEALAVLRNYATPLLALARRGLEAEAKLAALDDGTAPPEELSAYGAGLEIGKRSVERKLAAAIAEVERVRGRLEKATEFVLDLPKHGPPLRVFATWDGKVRRWWLSAYGPIQEAASLDAAWSAAEAQSARPAAPKGGQG